MKLQTVSRRAEAYGTAKVRLGTHAIGEDVPLAEGWAAGYRAAMRDVRQAHNRGDVAVHELLNDTERLK